MLNRNSINVYSSSHQSEKSVSSKSKLQILILLSVSLLFFACQEVPEPRNIKLVTYNVKQLPPITYVPIFGESYPEYRDEDGNLITFEERAALIAERIRSLEADVVVLNEVFDENSKEIFSDNLDGIFPFHIDYIGGDSDPEDSGLMLFSKHPFMPLGSIPEDLQIEEGDIELVANSLLTEDPGGLVAFTSFEECSGADCFSDKGAAIVKLLNVFTEEPFFVVFTHIQASSGKDDQEDSEAIVNERRTQFQQISSMIQRIMLPINSDVDDNGSIVLTYDTKPLEDTPVFIMGDLNVDGNPFHKFEEPKKATQNSEWNDIYNPLNNPFPLKFFTCGDLAICAKDPQNPMPTNIDSIPTFVDPWGFDNEAADLGRTNGIYPFVFDYENLENRKEGQRLDYILYRGPSILHKTEHLLHPIIPQHMTIEWSIAGKDGLFSDHLPVAINFLVTEDDVVPDYVLPTKAREVSPPQGTVTNLKMEIQVPGAMQWTKIDYTEGTYTVATPENIGFEVYKPYNLSQPITFIEERSSIRIDPGPFSAVGPYTLEGNIRFYNFPDPPYYIRTFAKRTGGGHDRFFTGKYNLLIRRHNCLSPDDFCDLIPTDTIAFSFPANKKANADDRLWFRLHTDQTDKGNFPDLEFRLFADTSLTGYNFDVYDFEMPDNPLLPNPLSNTTGIGKQLFTSTNSLPGNPIGNGQTEEKDYFFTIQRKDIEPISHEMLLTYTTNLTYFFPLNLRSRQEYSNSPHKYDDILFYIDGDGAPQLPQFDPVSILAPSNYINIGEVDEEEDGGPAVPLHNLIGRRKFITHLAVGLIEEDDENGELENDELTVFRGHLNNWHIDELSRDIEKIAVGHFNWIHCDDEQCEDLSIDPDDTEYFYLMIFRLSHRPDAFPE